MNIIEGQKTFPGLDAAFDLPIMKKLITEALQKENEKIQVKECAIADVKYIPGKKCILLYKTKIQEKHSKNRWEQFITGVLLKHDDTYSYDHKKSFFLKEPKIVLRPFPYDAALPWLPELYDEDSVKSLLCASKPKHQLKPEKVNISLLVYKPEMRATFEYNVFGEDRKSGQAGWRPWIAKTNVFRSPKRVFANYWALWKASKGKIPMPKPVGFVLNPPLTLQEKIEGVRLGAIVKSASFGEVMKKTAKLIARFHNLEIPLCNTRKLDQELRMINPRSEVLTYLLPELKPRIETLRTKIVAEMERRIDIRAPIHADFHHTNLLVDGTRVQLIDIDDMAFGDPSVDIGRFLSSLRIPSLRAFGSFEGLELERELFLDTYLKMATGNIYDIRLYESGSLFTSAASVFRFQRPNWKDEVHLLIDEAEKTFEKAIERKSVAFVNDYDRWKKLPLETRLKWALDKIYIQTLLTPALLSKKQQKLVFCKSTKHEEERSAYRILYRTVASEGKKNIKAELELLLFKKKTGRSLFKLLNDINEIMHQNSMPNLLPDPIAHFPEIGALVLEQETGKPFSALLGSPEAKEATGLLARFLATLHHLPLEVKPSRQKKENLQKSLEQISRTSHHEFVVQVNRILKNLNSQEETLQKKVAPTLNSMNLDRILFSSKGVVTTDIASMKVSCPYIDVGNFVAQLTLLGLKKGLTVEADDLIEHFYHIYEENSGISQSQLCIFEAKALLNVALGEMLTKKDVTNSMKLLKRSESIPKQIQKMLFS